jgi:hypothetical protein
MSDRLNPGDSLAVGGSIPSLDGGFTLTLQADGNLVLYHIGGAPAGWATGTVGRAVTQAIMQADGNFVLNGPAGPIWATHTEGHPGSYLVVQNDGNVVIYGPRARCGAPLADTEFGANGNPTKRFALTPRHVYQLARGPRRAGAAGRRD